MPSPWRFGDVTSAERDPLARPPRLGAVAAGVVAVVILLGAGAVALSGGNSPPAGPAARPLAPDGFSPTAATSADGFSPVPVAALAEGLLLVAPVVEWELFEGVPLPRSATAGPLSVDGSVRSGYERSQTGVLIAAVQLGYRYLLTPGDGWMRVLEHQVLPGAGRDVFARNRATVDTDAAVPPLGTYGQPAGFRFVVYTPDVASVQLVSRFPLSGNLQVVTVTLHWVDGDWRLELQPDGGSSPTAQAVSDLDGFVVWNL